MTIYLLDTNHLSAALNDDVGVRTQLRGDRVGTIVPALCELQVGIALTARRVQNQTVLRLLLQQVRIWPLNLQTAEFYGELYHELRNRGRVLSQVDIMLAALALTMGATLVTTDGDFEAIPQLVRESWVRR